MNPSTLRKRNLTAAKRSLKLILDTAQRHMEQLEAGEVPGDSFAASVTRYTESLVILGTLKMVAEDGSGPPGEDELPELSESLPADLAVLIQVTRGFSLLPESAYTAAGTPLARLVSIAYPDGLPAAAPVGP